MADPAAPAALAYIGDRRMAPGMRRLLARAAVTGQCYNGREMLFGPSPMRQRLVDSVRVLVRDVPGAAEGIDAAVAAQAAASASGWGVFSFVRRFRRLCVPEFRRGGLL